MCEKNNDINTDLEICCITQVWLFSSSAQVCFWNTAKRVLSEYNEDLILYSTKPRQFLFSILHCANMHMFSTTGNHFSNLLQPVSRNFWLNRFYF